MLAFSSLARLPMLRLLVGLLAHAPIISRVARQPVDRPDQDGGGSIGRQRPAAGGQLVGAVLRQSSQAASADVVAQDSGRTGS